MPTRLALALLTTILTLGGAPDDTPTRADAVAPALDVRALLTAARGAPPLICALAATSIWGGGYGGDFEAPATPLGATIRGQVQAMQRADVADADVRMLVDSLASDDGCVREISARLAARSGGTIAASLLVPQLGATSPRVRESAAFALGIVRGRGRGRGGELNETVVPALVRALRDDAPSVRADAAWSLGRYRDGRAVAPLVAALDDRESIVRLAAVAALGRSDSSSAVSTLVRVLQSDPAPEVRRSAAWALGNLRAREAAAALAAALGRERDAAIREMAAWALGELRASSGIDGLTNALRHDESDTVRETAAWALGELRDRTSIDALGEAAGSDRDADVRGAAAWALGQMRPHPAPPGLVRAVSDADEDVRLRAAWALSEIGDSTAIPVLRRALASEKNGEARRAQLRAIMRSGGANEETLGELLRSSDPSVREAAVRGLAGGSMGPWPWPWPRPRPFP